MRVRRWVRAFALGVLLAAAACGRGQDEPGLTLHGAQVYLDTSAPFVRAPDFEVRLESTVSAALAYWGGDWARLDGYSLTFTDDAKVACGDGAALGCVDGRSIRLTTQDPGLGAFACVEQTVLVHEIGHAVIGDPLHEDRRWMEMEEVSDALSGRTGYTSQGELPCTIYVSVWRHVLGAR
ncbi:MAG: hypothetical protein NDI82_11665 [Anaeromyxobacteraceae bacterium]|nr:hypothetical protein [Anaeromyxobacteraceae bacterium]